MAIPPSGLGTVSQTLGGASAGTAKVGTLAKLGKLFGFSSPWGVVAWGAVLGGSLLLSRFLRRGRPKIDVTTRESTPRDENVNRRWIMGKQRRVSGKLCYVSIIPPTSAAQAVKGSYKSNHLRLIYILSEGPIGDVKGIYLNDSKWIPVEHKTGEDANVRLPVSGYTLPTADVTRFKFPQKHVIKLTQFFDADGASQPDLYPESANDLVNRRYHDPTSTSTIDQVGSWSDESYDGTDYYSDSADHTVAPPANTRKPFYLEPKPWTENHKLTGVSYVVVDLFQPFHQEDDPNDDYWKNIPKLEFVVGGLKFTTPHSPTTPIESENPIDQLYWYDTQILKIPESKIDIPAYNAARVICEQTITPGTKGLDDLPSQFAGWLGTYKTFKRYMANHVIEEGEQQDAVHTRLKAACAGDRFEYDGKIHYIAGADTTSVLTLSDNELEDITEVKPWPAVSERYNQITAEISQNRASSFKEESYIITDDVARARDGELRNLDVTLDCVDHPLQAGYILTVLTRQQRQSFTFSAVIPPLTDMDQLKRLKPGATVKIASKELGFPQLPETETNKLKEFIVQSIQVRADFRVVVIFKEKIDGVYDDTFKVPALRPRGISFKDVIVPDAPTGLDTDEIVQVNKDGTVVIKLHATWDRSEHPVTEVQGRIKTPQGKWQPFVTNQYNTRAALEGVIADETYEIRARHWSSDNVPSNWSSIIEDTIDGDLEKPGSISDYSVHSLPQGIRVEWTNPKDKDFAAACVFISEQSGFDPVNDARVAAETLVATLNSDHFESGGYIAGREYYVRILAKDTSGNKGPLTPEMLVIPTVEAAEGVNIYHGSGQPSSTLGNNDDLYIQLNGALWEKENGVWVNSGIDLTSQGAILRPFHIEATEAVPRPEPNVTAPIGSVAFNTATGQYWERINQTTWLYRGDLTGEAGKNGRGWVPWLGSVLATTGVNGDYTVDPSTGNWYLRVNNAWVLQGDLSGKDGAKWFTYTGSGTPPTSPRVNGIIQINGKEVNIGDFALSTTSHRYYELTGSITWTLRGDLAAEVEGSKIVFFAADLGVNPSVHITTEQANVGDEAINTTTAEFWEKTATPNTWVKRGDLGQRVTTLTTNDPPTVDGIRDGDIAIADVDTDNRKLYVWGTKAGETSKSWILKGVLRGHRLTVDDSVPTDAITGDINWNEDGDIYRRKSDGNDEAVRTTKPETEGENIVDVNSNPEGCRVHSVPRWPPPTDLGTNGDAAYQINLWGRKINGAWETHARNLLTGFRGYYVRRVSSLPSISYNTPGYRALVPLNSERAGHIAILMPSTDAYTYNYETDSWTKVVKMCTAVSDLPAAPTNFRRTASTPTLTTASGPATVSFAWDAATGATGYKIRIVPARLTDNKNEFTISSSSTTYTIANLSRGTTYTFLLSYISSSGQSLETSIQFRTLSITSIQRPNTPSSVTVNPSSITQGSVTVNFTAGASTTIKPISRSTVGIYRNGSLVKSANVAYNSLTSNYSYTFTGIAANSGYTAKVYHSNSAGSGSSLESTAFTVPTITISTTLRAPTNLRLYVDFNDDDTEEVTARWNSVSGATSYNWSFTPSDAFKTGETLSGSTSSIITSAELAKTADGKTISFGVRAVDSTGQSSLTSGQLTINIDNLAVDSPGIGERNLTGLRVRVRQPLTVIIHIDGASSKTNLNGYAYQILRKRSSGGTFSRIYPTTSPIPAFQRVAHSSGILINFAVPTSVFSGHQVTDIYLVKVRWWYSDGYGPESSVSFRIQD